MSDVIIKDVEVSKLPKVSIINQEDGTNSVPNGSKENDNFGLVQSDGNDSHIVDIVEGKQEVSPYGPWMLVNSKVISSKTIVKPTPKSVILEASSSKTILEAKKQPETMSDSMELEAKRKLEQDHLLTMKLITKEAARRRDILFHPKPFSAVLDREFIDPKPPDVESIESNTMIIC
ncbi:Ankyrin repeat and EF-hand domain-containing protein 1 [Sesbania bispinosa]|nr:Ankyrin repeat and EF-hand domain-containing protein 1 [Sesbania bispinosa]